MDTLPVRPTRVHRFQTLQARALRRNATRCERIVWSVLRQIGRDHELHFRRQAPIGPYFADFCCHGLRVIIEADGGTHDPATDAQRDAWFQRAGYRTIRVSNEAIRNRDGDLTGLLMRELGLREAAP